MRLAHPVLMHIDLIQTATGKHRRARPRLLDSLDRLIEPDTRGDPESPHGVTLFKF